MSSITRWHTSEGSVTVETSVGSSGDIGYGEYIHGTLYVPAASSLTTLTFFGYDATNDAWVQIYDSSNAAVSRTVAASRAYAIPAECNGCSLLRIVGNATGAVVVSLKA